MDQQSAFAPDGRARNRPPVQYATTSRKAVEQVSLEDGINDLFNFVNDAIQYFARFERDFHQDIHQIREYCDKGLLEAVWTQKVHPIEKQSRDRRGSSRSNNFGDHHAADHESPTFRNTMRQMLSDLDAALAAAESFRPSQRRPSRYSGEDASKIRQQLHRSYQSLKKSFLLVMNRRLEMETVNTELEMLRVFLSRNGAKEDREVDGRDHGYGGGGHQSEAGNGFHDHEGYEEAVDQEGGGNDGQEGWTGGNGGGGGGEGTSWDNP
ncbi:MAG: hypothetical protein Q9170_004879 [Blastenia crenularia]